MKGFREIISSGASGSYFYFTPDRKYVVKTISKAEKDTLLRIAPAYLAHCRAHPDTLIKYLGCHSIRLPLNTVRLPTPRDAHMTGWHRPPMPTRARQRRAFVAF